MSTQSWKEIAEKIWQGGPQATGLCAVAGSMHGDEPAGAQVVRHVRETMDPSEFPWEVRLAVGNPRALEQNIRFMDSDLNRSFVGGESNGYERERSLELMEAFGSPRLLIDIHQTHCPTPPLAVVADSPAHLALSRALGLDMAVVGATRIYGPSMLSDWADSLGGIGITVESGLAYSEEAYVAAHHVVDRALKHRWDPGESIRVFDVQCAIQAPWEGLRFHRTLGNGSPVQAGEVLAERDGQVLKAPGDGVLLLPHEDRPVGTPTAVFALDRGRVAVDHDTWRGMLG